MKTPPLKSAVAKVPILWLLIPFTHDFLFGIQTKCSIVSNEKRSKGIKKTKNKTKVIDVTLSNFGSTGGPCLVGFDLVQSPV